VPDPLSQLVVDDPTSKGSKRKNQEETTRISIEIPKKEEDATADGGETDALVHIAKKKRATRSNTRRSLLQGGSAQNLAAGVTPWPKNLQRWLLKTLKSPVL
ncbi:hypothetical protein A2U01_0070665, partial [Trifolium medium]|nr:hypothetical protein [Trifolium medium]